MLLCWCVSISSTWCELPNLHKSNHTIVQCISMCIWILLGMCSSNAAHCSFVDAAKYMLALITVISLFSFELKSAVCCQYILSRCAFVWSFFCLIRIELDRRAKWQNDSSITLCHSYRIQWLSTLAMGKSTMKSGN